ncbi:MAG: hypothetical protein N3A68_07940 [Bacteroidia bacterium]|jgi:hypothetical protein|nr:hypothetical protein [Bacteroidia bacterium]GIV22825.1 MAG: hypothetical protein KatS3mg025_0484 [Bacteroidia bacterium]
MKRIGVFSAVILFAALSGSLWAQVTVIRDSISMGAGYAKQVYYSFQNGQIDTALAAGWHLAFEIPIRGAAIRANHARGVVVFQTTKDTNGWTTLTLADTVTRLYNDNCRWEIGALNQTAAPGNPFDVGWGLYDLNTHIVTGDSLYILGLPGGIYKKLWVQKLQGTVYTVRVANLDGSEDTVYAVDKTIATGRNFVYLNLLTRQVLNAEPPTSDWDIVFTPYLALLPPSGTPYPVTGVLQNVGVKAARIVLSSTANPDTLTPSAYSLDSCISTIGYDWKRYDMNTNSWILADTVYYLVQDKAGNLWRLRFVGFGGSSTGKVVFEKARLQQATALAKTSLASVQTFPNPAREGFYVTLSTSETVHATLYTVTGQKVWESFFSGQEVAWIARPAGLPAGTYRLLLQTVSGTWSASLLFE